ncbi:MAG TPA: hypothetical protein VJI97_03275, partial [Candidatus Nanoarchaeia archaeon]|nr:hypothetical protein [Candidatus Nanoarchaeia archaeon]
YALLLLVVVSLIVSTATLVYVYKIKTAVVPQTINLEDFLKKLTAHEEMKGYVGVAPLNVIQINNNNFANLQQQISGLDVSYVGSFILQYTDRVVVYDYAKDQIKGSVALQQPDQGQLPADFAAKLYSHPETNGLQNEQPSGGQIDAASLATLKQQFPEVYANAKVGDFLLRYAKVLVIYDYQQDKIVNAVQLA